jgi:hypothetical protein
MQPLSRAAFQALSGRMLELGLLHSLWIGLVTASLVALAFQAVPRLSHGKRHGVAQAASALRESIGLPRRESKTVTCEPLFVITP